MVPIAQQLASEYMHQYYAIPEELRTTDVDAYIAGRFNELTVVELLELLQDRGI